jgi:hypothetical protein
VITEEQRAKLRYKCQTDLFFLGKDVLKKDFTEYTHKPMCEFYVQKDPSFKTFKKFALAYKGSHDRIQLVQRNSYKSSIKVIDNVQWIINWPEIRILTCTADKDLSAAFIDEMIRYFTVQGKAERNPETGLLEGGNPTAFQELFPEHCITESEARAGEFETPARRFIPKELIFKEPTAGTLSMDASSSGWHCDVEDFDDPISDRNSETGNQLEKLEHRIDMITELLMGYGFRHFVATRYDSHDPYVKLLHSRGIKELYGNYESDGLKAMMLPCWWLKGHPYSQPDYKTWIPNEDDVDLHFPEGCPFSVLRKKMKKPKTFSSQQLNNPTQVIDVQFTRELLLSCIIDHTALPKEGTVFASWDFAYGQGTSQVEDHSCGIIGFLDRQRRWWIMNVIYDRFNFTEKCYQVVKAIKEYRPRRTCIEDTPGVKGAMTEPIDRQAKLEKVATEIDWVSIGQGVRDAKYIRICALHPWMIEHRIFFLNTIPYIDDVIQEFKNVRSMSKLRNDIPDAIARMVSQYSQYAVEVRQPRSQEESTRQFMEMAENEFHNMMYRTGRYSEGGDWDAGKWNRDYVDKANTEEQPDPESPSFAIDMMFRSIQ